MSAGRSSMNSRTGPHEGIEPAPVGPLIVPLPPIELFSSIFAHATEAPQEQKRESSDG